MNVVSVNWRPKLAVLTMLWKVALQHYDVTKKKKKTSQKEKKQVLTKWFSTKFKKKNQGK